jgi:prepilin-type processing-associated H-X9-DG protein
MISIHLDAETERRLRQLAESLGQDVSTLAGHVLEDYLHWRAMPQDSAREWAESAIALAPEVFPEEVWADLDESGAVRTGSILDNQEPTPMRNRSRRGMTLIELVVLVAVVFVLAALLLPAVHAAQLFGRRANCTRNLKEMALAIHNYHAVNLALPMSDVAGPGHGVGHSNFTALLPYMEQAKVYNAYNFHLEPWHTANGTAVVAKVASFLCPDNKNTDPVAAADARAIDDKPLPGKSKFARGHYGANWGGGRSGWGADFEKAVGQFRGVILPVSVKRPDGGMTRNVGFADVTDGLSFTLALVEKKDSRGWAVGGWAGSEFDVHTGPAYDGDDPKAQRAYTGSFHPGGPNAAFCDGSVRALRPGLDKKVWYALITRNGGEIIKEDELTKP